jgi:hypothetical protein
VYIDVSCVCNMVDRDMLFRIMLDLGFPAHYVRVVAGICSLVTTHIASPQEHTADLDVNGETIPGDTLSPFLFLLIWETPAAMATQWWPGLPIRLQASKAPAPTREEECQRCCG